MICLRRTSLRHSVKNLSKKKALAYRISAGQGTVLVNRFAGERLLKGRLTQRRLQEALLGFRSEEVLLTGDGIGINQLTTSRRHKL